MKDIKDYLHLYLDEDNPVRAVVCKNSNPHLQRHIQLSGWNLYANDFEEEFIKPILRPLSDMTEKENKESSKLYFDFMETQKPGTRDIRMMAHMTHWFLSKHFDLFGLIEAGIAIDKTK